MSTHLDPLILRKLQAFARRRRLLIIVRGVFAAVAMLVGTMILVAGMDFLFPLMPDWGRWALSGVAYASVLGIAWRLCLVQLLHAPDERRIARLVEHAEPKLREDLLSAVELGRSQGEVFDSGQFRGLLQADVSARMQNLEMASLLPVALIKRTLGVTAAIAVAVVALLLVSQNRFQTLFLRALLPGANLENVAATHLRIVRPEAGDSTVPQGDAVRVVIEVSGLLPKTAKVEVVSAADGRRVAEMTKVRENQFATTIQVGRENVRYRMQAGDGRTKYFQLTAVARPYEIGFEKTYTSPAYSQIPVKTVKEDGGSLSGLEGTEVELKITPNQPVKRGELRVDRGKEQVKIPLAVLPDGRLGARISLTGSGTYRVHLVAAKTDFENKFSPEYELRAAPDLVPSVELLEPKQDLISRSDELVKLTARATDDVGLARLVQVVKVNGGAWKETAFPEATGREARVERTWDLAAEGVKAGDLLVTKLIATDLQGSRTESRPLQITVVAAGFDMLRLGALKSRQTLFENVKALAGAGAVLADAARAARLKFDQAEAADPVRATVLAAWATAFADYETKLTAAWAALHPPLREAPANHEAADLVLLGRLLSLTHSGEARPMRMLLELATAQPAAPAAHDLVRLAHEGAGRVNVRTHLALDAYRLNVSAEEIDVVAELCLVMSGEQARIAALVAGAQTAEEWAKVTTRLRTVLSVGQNVDNVLDALKSHDGPAATLAQRMQLAFAREGEKMGRELDAGAGTPKFKNALAAFTKGTAGKAAEAFAIKQQLAGQVVATTLKKVGGRPLSVRKVPPVNLAETVAGTHASLVEQVDTAWAGVEQLLAAQAAVAKVEKLTPAERAALTKLGKLTGEQSTAQLEAQWAAQGEIFQARGDFEESRAAADNAFVGDLRRATVALQNVQTLARGDGAEKTAERLAVLGQSLRVLESGHSLQEIIEGLGALSALERWELRAPQARTVAVRDWAWLSTRLQMVPGEFRGLGLKDDETRAALDAAAAAVEAISGGPAALAATAEMGLRRQLDRPPASVRSEVDMAAGSGRAALALLGKAMALARSNLNTLTPPISELALALAKEEAVLKVVTVAHTAKAGAAQPTENKAEAQPQLARQQGINLRIETLKDLIRADANERSVLPKAQRERMRDADDAVLSLKDPPPAAAQALLAATQSPEAARQKSDLERATGHEQKIVDALHRIAGHYAALAEGKDVAGTRAELRKEEGDRQQDLDAQSDKAEKLAEMAEKSAADLLKELEGKLAENPEMQKELNAISKDTLANAKDKLDAAAKTEAEVAKKVNEQAAKDNAAQRQLSTLEAARLAASLARETLTAAENAKQSAEAAANKPAHDRAKLAQEKAAAAVLAADATVEAAQKLESAQNVAEIVAEAKVVQDRAGKIIPQAQGAKSQAEQSAAGAKREVQKPGSQPAANQPALEQAALAGQKGQATVDAAKEVIAAAKEAAEQAQAIVKNSDGAPQNPKLATAALEQKPVEQLAKEASTEVDRAARHEERLENREAGEKLAQLAAKIDDTAKNDVPAADQAVKKAENAAAAREPVQKAADKLAKNAEELNQATQPQSSPSPKDHPPQPGEPKSGESKDGAAKSGEPKDGAPKDDEGKGGPPKEGAGSPPKPGAGGPPKPGAGGPPKPGEPGAPPAATPAEQVALARLLDLLDSQLNAPAAAQLAPSPQPSPPGAPGPPSPAGAMAQASMAAMRQGSLPMPVPNFTGRPAPSQLAESKGGAGSPMPMPAGQLPSLTELKRGDWGRLPPKMAEEINKGLSETIPGEYREAVETYYRVIAEKSKKP